ncbi:MAG TPA: DUF3341 domain-containing protein [Balneolaceae bacterium]|nr:DUF3341 domain-containing protein [Balneolaceae bacterium]
MNSAASNKSLYGMLAEFRNPKELVDAARIVNKNGFKKYDTFSPYPIHGMDKAMSLKKSKLGWIVLVHGLLGFSGALLMISFMMVFDYPLNISGKTLFNVPAWIPVTFELTVLLSAFGAVFGMFFLNGLPKLNHPLFSSENFKKATNDGFFVCVESTDPLFDSEKVHKLLEEAGAANIEKIYDEI